MGIRYRKGLKFTVICFVTDGNKKYIKDCGGITSLIQQLTLTENEELSKTVKYLLQLCVSSGTVKVLNFKSPKIIAVITLKFEQIGNKLKREMPS